VWGGCVEKFVIRVVLICERIARSGAGRESESVSTVFAVSIAGGDRRAVEESSGSCGGELGGALSVLVVFDVKAEELDSPSIRGFGGVDGGR